jgi:uncharacterized protein
MPDTPRTRRLGLAGLTLLVWMAATAVVGLFSRDAAVSSLDEIIRSLGSGVVVNIVVDIGVLALATVLFRWNDLGFTAPDWGAWRRLMWFPLLTLAPFPILGATLGLPPGPAILFLALNTFLIALSEEWMFRGILFRALLTRLRLGPAVLTTSVLFGAVHVLNAFAFGDLRLALVQALAAMMTGTLLVALVLRTGSIWPAVAFHMAWNFGIMLIAYEGALDPIPEGPLPLASYLVPILIVLPNFLYALVLLRQVGAVQARASVVNET